MKVKHIKNLICAYRNCDLKPSARLYFPLGFSALFCIGCAKILVEANLAKKDSLTKPECTDAIVSGGRGIAK